MRPTDDEIQAELAALHDAHVWQVNAAVTAGAEEVASDLAAGFADDALALIVRNAHGRS